jgi:hypothetical protein
LWNCVCKMAPSKPGTIYVLFEVSDQKYGWLSNQGMEPPLPKSWKAWPFCGIRPSDAMFPKYDKFVGPMDHRAAALAGIEKHLKGLLKRGKLARYKVRFTKPA